MAKTVELLRRGFVTHNVMRLTTTRPPGFEFTPGQGVELVPEGRQGGPFTPTSLPDDGVLEFTIKVYAEHHGTTHALRQLEPGQTVTLKGPFGAIHWRGRGTFIAGGAGITPFLAILRQLASDGSLEGNRLLFSNHTAADIIEERELRHYLGGRCVLTCTREQAPGCHTRRIDEAFLREHVEDWEGQFYVCGPPGFMDGVTGALTRLGVEAQRLVTES